MAKRHDTKFGLSNLQFDRELDIPNVDFSASLPKDDRKPESSTKRFVGGVWDGIKDTMTSTNFIKKAVRETLPSGYGQALGVAEEATGLVKDLYNTAAKEMKPAVNDVRRATNRLLPQGEKYLPDQLAKKLKKWSESADQRSGGQIDPREQEIATAMEVFSAQVEDQDRRERNQQIRDTVKDNVDQKRHRDSINQLDAIRINTTQLASYLKVNAGFQRKSLELQYRHYYVAVDQLNETRRINAISESMLADIRKNTALPDFVKLNNTERLQEVLRNQFIDSFADGALAKRREFMRNFGAALSNQVKQRVSGFANGFRNAAMAMESAGMAADSMKGMEEFGVKNPGAAGFAGQMAGGMGAEYLGGKAFKKLKEPLSKLPGVENRGNQLSYLAENYPQLLREYAQGNKGDNGLFGPLVRLFKDATLEASSGPKTAMDVDNFGNLQKPGIFTRMASKSLTEIIPGYLSMLVREVQVLRTGDESIGLTKYDYKNNRFDSEGNIRKGMFKGLISADAVGRTKESIDDILNEIDPNKRLRPDQREILGRQLMQDNLRNRPGSMKRLTDPWAYEGQSARFGHEYADTFRDYFGKDEEANRKQLKFSRAYNRLGSETEYRQKEIQDLINAGQLDFLRDSGLVDERGNIDQKALEGYMLGAEYNPTTNPALPNARRSAVRDQAPVAKPRPVYIRPQTQVQQVPQFDYDRLAADLMKLDPNPSASKIETVLLRIEEQLIRGIPAFTIPMGAMSGGAVEGDDPEAGLAWYERTVGSLLKGGTRRVKSGISTASRWLSGTVGRAQATLKKGLEFGKGVARSGFEYATRFRDIYVPGEMMPRMLASKLKQGLYFDDATDKPINSFRDITGAVYELIDGEKSYVLTKDEAHRAYARSRLGDKLISGMGAALSKGQELLNNLTGGLTGLAQRGISMVKSAASFGMGKLDGPRDVYVRGKSDPVLLAVTMRAGAYYSKVSGKIIKRVSDIDGPVAQLVDGQEEVKLTEDDLRGGLLDATGKPMRVGLARIAGAAADIAKGAWNVMAKAGKSIGNFVSKGFGFLGDVISKQGLIIFGGKEMLDHLAAIHQILDERLPGKKAFGDSDGDGERDGSAASIFKKRQAARDEKTAEAKAQKERGDGGKGLLATLAGLFSRKKHDEEEDGDDSSLLSDAADVAEIGDAARGRGEGKGKAGKIKGKRARIPKGGKPGMFRRGADWFKRMPKSGKVGGAVGLALTGAAAYSIASDKTTTGSEKDKEYAGLAGAAAGGLAGMKAGAALGTMFFPGIGTVIGGAMGGIIGGVIGDRIGNAAGGALFSKRLGPIGLFRMAQYGFLKDEQEFINNIVNMENDLESAVSFDERGLARLDGDKVNAKKLIESFGIDTANKVQTGNWLNWYNSRFKYVFLSHMSALHKVKNGTKLEAIDQRKLSQEEQKQYLEIVKWPDGPYDFMVSPFPASDRLRAGRAEVSAAWDFAKAETLKGEPGKPGQGRAVLQMGDPTKMGKAATATTATVALNAKAVNQPEKNQIQKLLPDYAGIDDKGYSKLGGTIFAAANGAAVQQTFQGRVDALSAVRFKTYGLVQMEADKVRSIAQLEQAMEADLKFDSKGVATWEGSPDDMLNKLSSAFGVDQTDSSSGANWLTWFRARFLPVYLNYVTSLYASTKKTKLKDALMALRPQGELDAAIAVYGTMSDNGKTVWLIPFTPWPNYKPNNDVSTTNANIQALKDAAKAGPLNEAKAADRNNTPGSDKQSTLAGTAAANANKDASKESKGFWESTKSAISNAASATGSWLGKATDKVMDVGASALEAVGIDTGRAISSPAGTGGSLDKIPMPTKDGSADGARATITAAANMVGVDPNMMMIMAGIESGFQSKAKAPTSTAKGYFQFLDGTWGGMMKQHASKYGIPANTTAYDPRANALLGAEFIKGNIKEIQKVKQNVTDTDVYMAHFLGAGGAKAFFKNMAMNPDAPAAAVMKAEAAANKNIFYDKNGTPKSFAAVYAHMNGLMRDKGKKLGLGAGKGSEAIVPTKPGTATPKGTDSAQKAQSAPGAPRGAPIPLGAPGAPKVSANADNSPLVPSGGYAGSVNDVSSGTAQPNAPLMAANDALSAPIRPIAANAAQQRQLEAQQRVQAADSTTASSSSDPVFKSLLDINMKSAEYLRQISVNTAAMLKAASVASVTKPAEKMSDPPIKVAKPA